MLFVFDRAKIEQQLRRANDSAFTYSDVGATAGELPPGYRHDHHRVVVGQGHETFRKAREALRGWEMHKGAGFEVYPEAALLTKAATMLVTMELGPLTILIPTRVVYVVDEPRRFGFAYGTLPGHPERGEEAFIVEWTKTDEVVFTITAFSRPVGLARLGGPIARRVQTRATKSYLRAMVELTRRDPASYP